MNSGTTDIMRYLKHCRNGLKDEIDALVYNYCCCNYHYVFNMLLIVFILLHILVVLLFMVRKRNTDTSLL